MARREREREKVEFYRVAMDNNGRGRKGNDTALSDTQLLVQTMQPQVTRIKKYVAMEMVQMYV